MREPDKRVDDLSYEVIGAAIAVHKVIGSGYIESVYENALCIELGFRNIPYEKQFPFVVQYRDAVVGEGRVDILVDKLLVVELKSSERLVEAHMAQALYYLSALNLQLALLINFRSRVLKEGIRRVVQT